MAEDTFKKIEEAIKAYAKEAGVELASVSLARPDSFTHGDLSTPVAFQLAKSLKRPPLQVAEELAAHLTTLYIEGVGKVTAVAPAFINISFTSEFFGDVVGEVLTAPRYGENTSLAGQVWAIEHTSPNPNKAMHLGHLRNNLVGMSLVRLMEWNGARVISEAIDNNRGIAIAKLMWGFLARMKKDEATPTSIEYWVEHPEAWYTPEELELLPDLFVSKCYEEGSKECADPEIEAKVRELVVLWEDNDEDVWKLWSHVLSYSYAGMERTLTRLGNHWDKVWHEHEHYAKGKAWVEKGLVDGVFKRLPDGAVLTNLETYNIPDTILMKRDGTSLYITQDLALTAMKKEAHKADRLIWVIGPDQSLAMRQLFAVCEQLGIGKVEEFTHVPSGYVGLKDGEGNFQKMSSRAGTVVLIDDVIDAVRDSLIERGDSKKEAETLALGAVKFSILKVDRNPDIAFDVQHSIETKGDSGIYVLYAYVRAASILRKAKAAGKTADSSAPVTSGTDVARLLLYFPNVVLRSREDLSIHHVAQYLLELAGALNAWYGEEIILDGGPNELQKLALIEATKTVLKSGLTLMGIEAVEEM